MSATVMFDDEGIWLECEDQCIMERRNDDNKVIAKEYVDKNYVKKSDLKEILYEDYGETIYDYHYAYEELFDKIENLLLEEE